MGNQQYHQDYQSSLLKKYQLIEHTKQGQPIFKSYHSQSNAYFILKTRTFSSKQDSLLFHQYLQKKIKASKKFNSFYEKNLNNINYDQSSSQQNKKQQSIKEIQQLIYSQQNIIQLRQIYQRWQNNYCGKWYKIYTLIQYSQYTFKQQIKQRLEPKYFYTEDQLWTILFSISCGILQLQSLGTYLNNIDLSMIFLNQNGVIKLIDPSLMDQYYVNTQVSLNGNLKNKYQIEKSVAKVIIQLALLKLDDKINQKSLENLANFYSYPLYCILSQLFEDKMPLKKLVETCIKFLKIDNSSQKQIQLKAIIQKQQKEKKGIRLSQNYVKKMRTKFNKVSKQNQEVQKIKNKNQGPKDTFQHKSYHFVKRKYSNKHLKDQKSNLSTIIRSHSRSQKRLSSNFQLNMQNRKKSTTSLDYRSWVNMNSFIQQSPHLSSIYSPTGAQFKNNPKTGQRSRKMESRRNSELSLNKAHKASLSNLQYGSCANVHIHYQSYQKSKSSNILADTQAQATFSLNHHRNKTDFNQQVKKQNQIEFFIFKDSSNKHENQTAHFKREKDINVNTKIGSIKKKLKFKHQHSGDQLLKEKQNLGEIHCKNNQASLQNTLKQSSINKSNKNNIKINENQKACYKFPKKTSFIKKKKYHQITNFQTRKIDFSSQLQFENNQKNKSQGKKQSQIKISHEILSISPVGIEKCCSQQDTERIYSPPQFLDMIFEQDIQTFRHNYQSEGCDDINNQSFKSVYYKVCQKHNQTIVQVSERFQTEFTSQRKKDTSVDLGNILDLAIQTIEQNAIQNQIQKQKQLSESKASNYSQIKLRKIKQIFGSQSTVKTQQNKSNEISSRITVKKQYCSSFLQGMSIQDIQTLNIKNGFQKVLFDDGAYYEGQWINNQMHGYGKLFYPSGDLAYCGFWMNNLFQGKGILLNDITKQPQLIQQLYQQIDYKNMSNLQGNWYRYQGNFKNDLIHGQGVLTFRDGSKIKGQWINNKLQGVATFQIPTVKKVIGYYQNNILVKVYQQVLAQNGIFR